MCEANVRHICHTLQRLPTKFISDLQNDPSLRGAGRMFLYIRRFVGSKYHPETQKSILSVHFSNYQIQKYLSVLVAKKMMRRDQAGNYYLTSVEVLCPDDVNRHGERIRKLRYVLDDQALRDGQYFKKVIAGVVVAAYTRSLRYGSTSKKASRQAATNDPTGIGSVYVSGQLVSTSTLANSSMVQGCALTILAKHTGRHKSTMSRWRKKGQAAGYTLGRWYFDLNACYTVQPSELSEFRAQGQQGIGIDPNRLVIRKGKVVEEGPSQIIVSTPIFFKK